MYIIISYISHLCDIFTSSQTRCQGERVEYVPSKIIEEDSKPQRGRSSRSTRSVKSGRSTSKAGIFYKVFYCYGWRLEIHPMLFCKTVKFSFVQYTVLFSNLFVFPRQRNQQNQRVERRNENDEKRAKTRILNINVILSQLK